MPLLFLCKSFDLISDAARLKLAKNTMTVEQILIFIFSVCFFFSSESMPGLLLSLATSEFYIKVHDRSPLTSHISPQLCLTAGCVNVDGESRDLRLSSPGLTRPRDVTPPGSWPPHGLGSPLHHERERERQEGRNVRTKFVIRCSSEGDGRISVTAVTRRPTMGT